MAGAFAIGVGTIGIERARAFDPGAPIVRAEPDSVGVSTARLKKLTAAFEKEVADKRLPGAVAMISRKGKLVYAQAFGVRDPRTEDAMKIGSIFRIYSMTKPFAAVAGMILVEDGVLQLTDPVAKWLPAFKDVKVSTPTGDVPAERPMTVRDLFRHTAGLPYGELTQNTAVKDALAAAGLYKPGVIDFDIRDMTAAEQVERLAKVPLIHQPGTTWDYSLATDVLGRVVEAASGKRLGDFMQARVFGPLKMTDTAFRLPDGQGGRLAEPFDKDPASGTPIKLIDVSKQPGNDSAGAGAVSTAADYLRFAQMLANNGELDGERILSRTSIKLMTSDHLGPRLPIAATPGGGVLGRLRLHVRAWACGASRRRFCGHPRLGRRLQLGRLRGNRLLDRPEGGARRRPHGAVGRRVASLSPQHVPAARLPGDRRLSGIGNLCFQLDRAARIG